MTDGNRISTPFTANPNSLITPYTTAPTGNGSISYTFLKNIPGYKQGNLWDPVAFRVATSGTENFSQKLNQAQAESIKNERQLRINNFNQTGTSVPNKVPIGPNASFREDYQTHRTVKAIDRNFYYLLVLGGIFYFIFYR